jgi:hypothetical protein
MAYEIFKSNINPMTKMIMPRSGPQTYESPLGPISPYGGAAFTIESKSRRRILTLTSVSLI